MWEFRIHSLVTQSEAVHWNCRVAGGSWLINDVCSVHSVSYSRRSAVIGFTRIARRAGRKQVRSAATESNKLEQISANGSLGLT